MAKARDNYNISGSTVEELKRPLNFLLQRLADRMDRIEGIRGTATMDSDLDMNGHRAIDLGPPTDGTDSARSADLPTFDQGLAITGTVEVDGALHVTGTVTLDTALGATSGGTGLSAYVLGDILYSSADNTLAALSGNTTTTRKFLRQVGNGTSSAAPAWDTLTSADITDFNEAAQDAVGLAFTDTAEIDFTYDDGAGTIAASLVANSVSYAKLQQVSNTSRLLGRVTAGAGTIEELTAANVLSILAGTAQTWSALHTFTAGSSLSAPSVSLSSSRPLLNFLNSSGGSNAKNWLLDCVSATTMAWRILNDALSTARDIILATRSGNVLSSIAFGNATDNNTFSFLGTGAASFGGSAKSSNATAGVGYATGAGGAVTQATSRTTGVTIDKVCGAITLVSAAGSASFQTFTVSNSAVVATDAVVVQQKSGTDKYQIFVTAIAAGSFDITFATTGGTTVEQPVFNFAVIKAVAA